MHDSVEQQVLALLHEEGGVLTGQHFVFTSDMDGLAQPDGGGAHSTAYVNIRTVAPNTALMNFFSGELARRFQLYQLDIVIGPETLGRSLAQLVALHIDGGVANGWCEWEGEGQAKRAVFSPKLGLAQLLPGMRVGLVDDLLTSGGSLQLASELVESCGGEVVVAGAVVRRTPNVTAQMCGAPVLEVLADIPGFTAMSKEGCAMFGPCSRREPMVLRPGHGHRWVQWPENKEYPTA